MQFIIGIIPVCVRAALTFIPQTDGTTYHYSAHTAISHIQRSPLSRSNTTHWVDQIDQQTWTDISFRLGGFSRQYGWQVVADQWPRYFTHRRRTSSIGGLSDGIEWHYLTVDRTPFILPLELHTVSWKSWFEGINPHRWTCPTLAHKQARVTLIVNLRREGERKKLTEHYSHLKQSNE